jgi:hypothetical protein
MKAINSSKFLSRFYSFLILFSLTAGSLMMVSCEDDDDPAVEEYDLAGNYKIQKATLTSGGPQIAAALGIPAALIPTDITAQMSGAFLGEAPCTNPANGAVNLKSNLELFFVCIGETNQAKTGTWSVNSQRTELSLNLSVSTGNFALVVSDLQIDEATDVVSGNINNFPITKSFLAGFLAGLPAAQRDAILAGIPNNTVVLINVAIEFKKIV